MNQWGEGRGIGEYIGREGVRRVNFDSFRSSCDSRRKNKAKP